MSSTNRKNANKRHISDYYITPIEDIVIFLKEFNKIDDVLLRDSLILDPCAGGDEDNPMSYPVALERLRIENWGIYTIDIRKDSRADIKEDYLKLEPNPVFDVVITNPPFNIALPIIEKAFEDCKDGGYVIMLLRLNFLESKTRKSFFDKYMPKYIFVHHKRMSFTPDGKTDSIAYAHFVWQKGHYPEFSKIKVI